MNVRALAALLLPLACVAQLQWPADYPAELAAANKTCAAKDFDECRRHLSELRVLLDGRGDIVYKLAALESEAGNRAASVEWLTLYSKTGLRLVNPAADPRFASWKDAPEFASLLARLKENERPISAGAPFVAFAENDLVPEDIAYDPKTARFFVSTVRHRKILAVTRDAKISTFVPASPDLWAMMALGVDARRRWLWATTVDLATDRSALLKYSLDSGKLIRRYELPGRHALGDMAVGASGDVFIADGHGAVYRVDPAAEAPEIFIPEGTFRSPQIPAISADGRRLFVPDYSRGISAVDLTTKQAKLLPHPPELSLGGIDGLYLAGNTMLAIQNGTAPERVIRMRLNDALDRILDWEVIEANWQGLGDPTHGVVVDGAFYFIVNSGWDQLDNNANPKPNAAFTPAAIRRMPLSGKAR